MTTAQKIIKYLAIAFAIFLIVTIISTIVGVVFGVASALNLKKDEKQEETKNITLEENSIYLDIDLKYTNLILKTGENFVAETNNSNVECKQNGNKLVIKETENKWFSKNNNRELTVYIPMDLEFEKVQINTGAGNVNIESIIAEKIKLDLGAGNTRIQNIISKNTNIDAGVGNLVIEEGEINNLNLDSGVGKIKVTAKITGESKISTGVGNLELNLLGEKEDYKFKVNKGIGEVKIGEQNAKDNEVIGNGENFISINGGVGEIKVNIK